MAAAVLPALTQAVVTSLSEETLVGADEVCRLRVSYGGKFVQDAGGHWRYQGGESHLESIPTSWRYADLMHRLAERCNGAVALKYFEPNDEMHPDNLLTVSDDDDLKEMFEEYRRALRQPATPVRTFRLRAVLFPAVEQTLTEEELADGTKFFTTSEALSKAGSSRALIVSGPSDAVRRSSLGSSSSNGADNRGGGMGGMGGVLLAQRSWWAEGVQAGWVPGAPHNGAPPLLLEDGSEHGACGYEQIEGGAYSTNHSPHYYPQHGQGGNMAEEAANGGGAPLLGFQQYDKYGDQQQHPAVQWGPFDAHPAAMAGDMYQFDHHGYSGEEGHGFGGGVQFGGVVDDGWTDELVGKLAAVTTNGGGSGSGAMGGSGMAPSSAAISRTASVVANGGGLGMTPAHQGGNGGGSAWPTPWTSPRTMAAAAGAAADGLQQLGGTNAFSDRTPRAGSATPRTQLEHPAPQTQTGAVAGSTVTGLSASVSPHYAAAAARAHTKDGLPTHISAFGDGSGDGFGDVLDGSSAGANGGRVVDCLPDHLFSVDGQLSQQTALGAPAAVSDASDAKHMNGRAGGEEGDLGLGYADDMMASFKADAEGQWAAVAVANAGLADENEDELLAYNAAAVQPFTPRAMPETPRAAKERAAVAEHLRQVSADSVSSASLPINGVHRVLKEDLNILGPVGEGAFGAVSLAHSPIFGKVATKWLKPGKVERHSESFLQEAATLQKVNHPNVLRFYGVVVDSDAAQSVVGIITEYLPDGSLSAFLRRQREYLPLSKRTALALDAAKGLAYLHAMDIVHFDLKPDNLLLDGPAVKVADFGLAKHKTRNFVSGVKDLRGTLPYMAPEVVNDPQHVSEKADVWSLGMVLWELLTLEIPFAALSPQHIIHGLMLGNLQPPVPEWCEEEWRSLMEACWVVNPAARPSMRDICRQLELVLQMALAHGL